MILLAACLQIGIPSFELTIAEQTLGHMTEEASDKAFRIIVLLCLRRKTSSILISIFIITVVLNI